MRRLAIILFALVAVLVVAAAIGVATFDWNRARPWIESAAGGALGRAVTIGGDIEPQLSLVPTLRAGDVRLSRSSEKTGPLLAEFAHLEVQFPLLPLIFQRRFELRGLTANDGRLVIAEGPSGTQAESAPQTLAWLESLPAKLRIVKLRIELGAGRGEQEEILIERASAGSCGDRLELHARRQDVSLVLAAKLVCPGEARVGLSAFEAKLGESTLAGSLELDLGGKRPRLSGEITSADLRIDELARLEPTDATDSTDGQEGSGLDAELPLASLASLDVDVKLAGTAIHLPGKRFGVLGGLAGRLQIEAGHLDLQVGKATLWDGALTAQLRTEGTPAEPRVRLKASLAEANVAHLFTDGRATGQLDGEIELSGGGRTPRALLAGAEGRASLKQGVVDFSSPPLGPLGRDVLGILFAKKGSGQLQCAVTRTTLADGLGPLAIVIDTPGTTVAGVGSLDLRDLRLDVVLRPRPHHASVGTIKTPVLISGPISAPRVRLAKKAMLEGAGKTALFGALNPFLLAAPLVDLGTGGGNPCENAIEAATVEALKNKGQLEKSVGAVGKGGRWLEGLIRRKPSDGS